MIIRGEGPKGGPGMPEMLTPTSAIMGAGLGKVWCLNSKLMLDFCLICKALLSKSRVGYEDDDILFEVKFIFTLPLTSTGSGIAYRW